MKPEEIDVKDRFIGDNAGNLIEVLSKKSRFQIFLHLLVYPELSLTKLSESVGKSKSTVHRDLQELIEAGIIKEHRQDSSTKSKYYVIQKKTIFQDLHMITSPDKMDKLSAEERKNTFNLLMSMIDSAFFILENSIGIVTKYVERFKEAKQDLSLPDHQTFLRWMKEFGVSLRFAPLSNKTFPIYEKHLKNFYSEVNSELLTSELQEDLFNGDYLAWNVILPMKKALK